MSESAWIEASAGTRPVTDLDLVAFAFVIDPSVIGGEPGHLYAQLNRDTKRAPLRKAKQGMGYQRSE